MVQQFGNVRRKGERDVACMGGESGVCACMHYALCMGWGRMRDWERVWDEGVVKNERLKFYTKKKKQKKM